MHREREKPRTRLSPIVIAPGLSVEGPFLTADSTGRCDGLVKSLIRWIVVQCVSGARPTNLGRRALGHSTGSLATAANDAAISLFRNDEAVTASTRSSEPALKPCQPNYSRPMPKAISGTFVACAT